MTRAVSAVSAVPEIRERLMPHSRLDGSANLLVLPNLDAANTAYNLTRSMTDGIGIGPVLMGMAKPAHVLTPSATVRRVVNMTAIAAVEAQIGLAADFRGDPQALHDLLVPIPAMDNLSFANGQGAGRGSSTAAQAMIQSGGGGMGAMSGAAGAGKGWRMLMEALSAGRSISLPAQSAGGAKLTARATSCALLSTGWLRA